MRVFIAGATGVLGRRVVKRLVERGHTVIGLSRSNANNEWLRRNGAEPRHGDLFNPEVIEVLTADCEAILHLATAIPTGSRTSISDWETNDRIRILGTRSLVEAAVRNRCQLYLQQSVVLVYGDRGDAWVDEETVLPAEQPKILASAVEMEQIVREAVSTHDLPAATLRFGAIYCLDSAQTQATLLLTRGGSIHIIGDGNVYTSLIHGDEAASAVIQVLEKFPLGLGESYNICDDEPVKFAELFHFLADALDAERPGRVTRYQGRQMLGPHVLEAVFNSIRCSNARFKERFGWSPQYPDYRAGYNRVTKEWRESL